MVENLIFLVLRKRKSLRSIWECCVLRHRVGRNLPKSHSLIFSLAKVTAQLKQELRSGEEPLEPLKENNSGPFLKEGETLWTSDWSSSLYDFPSTLFLSLWFFCFRTSSSLYFQIPLNILVGSEGPSRALSAVSELTAELPFYGTHHFLLWVLPNFAEVLFSLLDLAFPIYTFKQIF